MNELQSDWGDLTPDVVPLTYLNNTVEDDSDARTSLISEQPRDNTKSHKSLRQSSNDGQRSAGRSHSVVQGHQSDWSSRNETIQTSRPNEEALDDEDILNGESAHDHQTSKGAVLTVLEKLECILVACICVAQGGMFVLPFLTYRDIAERVGARQSYLQILIAFGGRGAAWLLGSCVALGAVRRCAPNSDVSQDRQGRVQFYNSSHWLIFILPLSGVLAALANGATCAFDRLDPLTAAWFVVGSCGALLDVGTTQRGVIGTLYPFRAYATQRTRAAGISFYVGVLLAPMAVSMFTDFGSRWYWRHRRSAEMLNASEGDDYWIDSSDQHDDYGNIAEEKPYEYEFNPVQEYTLQSCPPYANPFVLFSSVLCLLCIVYLAVVKYVPYERQMHVSGFTSTRRGCVQTAVVNGLGLLVLLASFALESTFFTLFTVQFAPHNWSLELGIEMYYAWFIFWSLFLAARVLCLFLNSSSTPDVDLDARPRDTKLLCLVLVLLATGLCLQLLSGPRETLDWIILIVMSSCIGALLPLFCTSYPASVYGGLHMPQSYSMPRACVHILVAQTGYFVGLVASVSALKVADNSTSLQYVASILAISVSISVLVHRLILIAFSQCDRQDLSMPRSLSSAGWALLREDNANDNDEV